MTLHVVLRDGFRNDTVSVMVNGKEVYRKAGVTTDLTISFADSIDVPVQGAVARLQVAVAGGQQRSDDIRVSDTPFVEVRMRAGKMEFQASREAIPML